MDRIMRLCYQPGTSQQLILALKEMCYLCNVFLMRLQEVFRVRLNYLFMVYFQ